MQTIFALASARGKAGVAVIRISGARSHEAVATLVGVLPAVRRASLRKLTFEGLVLDEALVLLFDAGSSFTGEMSAELQVHGSVATVRAVLAALGQLPGLRIAEPGEFSRRALENGCMDLTQIEGLADLIEAETEAQRRQAISVMSGALGKRAGRWRADLVQALSLLEVTIDFSDEELPEGILALVEAPVERVLQELGHELRGSAAAERVRDGFEVAILGAPNVGKSTLLNALAGREAALTSDVAGTTRDVIEVRIEIAGLAVTVLDTAGLRDTGDRVEKLGIERALERARAADLRIFLKSGDEELPVEPEGDDLVLFGKADLGIDPRATISGVSGEGLDQLIARVGEILSGRVAGASLAIRERHRQAMRHAIECLEEALDLMRGGGHVELASAVLRRSVRHLEVLIGKVGVEDLLDEIFARFCIGK